MKTDENKSSLKSKLSERTKEGELYEKLPHSKVRCFACGHRCLIGEGKDGICRVRSNRGGVLYVPHNYVGALQFDPIEKKPFFHVLPGSLACSFGMLGCDFQCAYCQNWFTSQTIRDENSVASPQDITASQLVQLTLSEGAETIASTYNEPLITSEWGVEVFKEAKKQNLRTAYISNGNGTPEVLSYIKPWVDFYKVDLKSFREKNYRQLGGQLKPVLETIQSLHQMGFWLELLTLVIPGFNDSNEELTDIAKFIASISADIPWHVTAFHKDYQMMDPENTSPDTLLRTAEIGRKTGLHFVYAGNLPGKVGDFENTYCPSCNALLIERMGYRIIQNRIISSSCPNCRKKIPGRWE